MVIIFDLDDTLYNEYTFVKSGFKIVADYISSITFVDSRKIYLRMLKLLKVHGRGKVFDMILNEYSIATKKNVKKCLSIYRGHKPNIKLYPKVLNIIKKLSSYNLYLVTDGNKLVQTSKIRALGIQDLFIKLFITGYFGKKATKPSLYCFEKIKVKEKCSWPDLVYIGDDPNKDFVNLNKLGVKTVRVHSGRYAHVKSIHGYNAKYNIESISNFSLNIFKK